MRSWDHVWIAKEVSQKSLGYCWHGPSHYFPHLFLSLSVTSCCHFIPSKTLLLPLSIFPSCTHPHSFNDSPAPLCSHCGLFSHSTHLQFASVAFLLPSPHPSRFQSTLSMNPKKTPLSSTSLLPFALLSPFISSTLFADLSLRSLKKFALRRMRDGLNARCTWLSRKGTSSLKLPSTSEEPQCREKRRRPE